MKQPLQIRWNPKSDITAYELALCIGVMMEEIGARTGRNGNPEKIFNSLQPEAQRHFERV